MSDEKPIIERLIHKLNWFDDFEKQEKKHLLRLRMKRRKNYLTDYEKGVLDGYIRAKEDLLGE